MNMGVWQNFIATMPYDIIIYDFNSFLKRFAVIGEWDARERYHSYL
jgi:hypothetical protein